jgi:hypothetical protein
MHTHRHQTESAPSSTPDLTDLAPAVVKHTMVANPDSAHAHLHRHICQSHRVQHRVQHMACAACVHQPTQLPRAMFNCGVCNMGSTSYTTLVKPTGILTHIP